MKASYDKAPGSGPGQALEVIAKGCGLEPALVRAIVQVESSGNPRAIRYEPAFYERYVKAGPYPQAEHRLLASSLGLMQIMGLVAREHGFTGELSQLFIPEVGLLYGCLHLARFWERYGASLEDSIAAYNAGSARRLPDGRYVNQEYVGRVLKAFRLLTQTIQGKEGNA